VQSPALGAAVALAQGFAGLIRQRQPTPLEPWLIRAATSSLPPVRRFAKGLREDAAAGQAAVTRPLVADMPELGTLTRQEVAALIGVAPFTYGRGTQRGKRAIWGGRAHVRTVRYMRPLAAVRHTPVLKACYERLPAKHPR